MDAAVQVDWERCGYCRQYGVYQVDMIGDYLGTKLYWAIWIIGLFEMWVYTMRRNIIAPCVRSPFHSFACRRAFFLCCIGSICLCCFSIRVLTCELLPPRCCIWYELGSIDDSGIGR